LKAAIYDCKDPAAKADAKKIAKAALEQTRGYLVKDVKVAFFILFLWHRFSRFLLEAKKDKGKSSSYDSSYSSSSSSNLDLDFGCASRLLLCITSLKVKKTNMNQT
jgi:hypothetical protein